MADHDMTVTASSSEAEAVERDGFFIMKAPTIPCPTMHTVLAPDRCPANESVRCPGCTDTGRLTVEPTKRCHGCAGTGVYCAEPCNVCHGARTVPVVVEMVTAERVTCPQCDGEWGWTNPTDYGTGREDDACAYCEKGTVPAGIVLTGAVEALPVVGVDNNLKDDEVAVVVFVQWIAIREQVGPKKWLYTHIDHHFGDRPRLKVGDTAWRIRRDVRQFFEEARKP